MRLISVEQKEWFSLKWLSIRFHPDLIKPMSPRPHPSLRALEWKIMAVSIILMVAAAWHAVRRPAVTTPDSRPVQMAVARPSPPPQGGTSTETPPLGGFIRNSDPKAGLGRNLALKEEK
jgi:hypothetical protein